MADSKAKPAKAANKTPPKSPGDPARAAKRLSLESEGANEGATAAPELSALEEAFRRFAVHGDTRATGKEMHGKNWSKLCKDCHVIFCQNILGLFLAISSVMSFVRAAIVPGASLGLSAFLLALLTAPPWPPPALHLFTYCLSAVFMH